MDSSDHQEPKRFSSMQAILAASCSAAFLTDCSSPVKMTDSFDGL